MKKQNLLTGFFLALATFTQGAMAISRAGESSLTVLAHGMPGLRIEGKSSDVSLEEDSSVLTFTVPIAPIETGISLRDKHLRQMLETEKFPAAVLRVERSGLKFPKERETAEGTAKGQLTLHGQSRPVEVRYRAEGRAGGATKIRGSLQLDMRDFEIQYPSYFGVTVAPDVEVKLELLVEGA